MPDLIQGNAARAGSKPSFLLATRVALLAATPLVMLLLLPSTGKAETHIQLPQTSFTSGEVGVIINDSDPL